VKLRHLQWILHSRIHSRKMIRIRPNIQPGWLNRIEALLRWHYITLINARWLVECRDREAYVYPSAPIRSGPVYQSLGGRTIIENRETHCRTLAKHHADCTIHNPG
jgi:hypothetical protein